MGAAAKRASLFEEVERVNQNLHFFQLLQKVSFDVVIIFLSDDLILESLFGSFEMFPSVYYV